MYSSTLRARQLAALAGLRALGHLDLQLVGVDEVVDRDAEAPRGDLLDRRAALVVVALRVLAALARVRLAADRVHRDREVLVRLARQRAEAHRAGREALDDLRPGLDLLERDRRLVGADLEQPAQRRARGGLLVGDARELVGRPPRRRCARRAGAARSCPGSTCGARRRAARRRRRRPAADRSPLSTPWKPRAWRVNASVASTSRPTPPMREAVPVKWRSISERESPTASKICAPQ